MPSTNNTIKHKRSSSPGAAPSTVSIEQSELAINLADGKLYTKNSNDEIINLGVTTISGAHIFPASGTFDTIIFNDNGDPDLSVRQIAWNNSEAALAVGVSDTYQMYLGEELHYRVRNNTGSTILAGTAVYATGLTPGGNNRIEVAPNVADGSIREVRFMGLMTEDCISGENGYVTHFGYIRHINTNGGVVEDNDYSDYLWASGEPSWNEGDILYVHPTVAGKLTKIEPKHSISVAIILNVSSNNGKIFVRPLSYGHLSDNHDVNTSGVMNNQYLRYDSATDYWVPTSSGIFTHIVNSGTIKSDYNSVDDDYYIESDGNGNLDIGNNIGIGYGGPSSPREANIACSFQQPLVLSTSINSLGIKFNTNNADRMVINNSGNVGIGVSDPSAKLDIYSSASGSTLFNVEGTNGNLFSVVDSTSGSLMSVNDITGLPAFEVFSDHSVVAGRFNTNDFVISSGGNVLVGTSSGNYKFQVYGSGNDALFGYADTGTAGGKVRIYVGNNDNNSQGLKVYVDKTSGSNFGINGTANGSGAIANYGVYGYAAQATTNFALYGYAAGGTVNRGLWIDAGYGIFDDRVGIGTLSPITLLDVSGVITATGGNSTNWNTAYGWGDHASAGYQSASTALTTSTTFGGDVSGTYNNIVVADDSHNHIIGNVDGLQSALDLKAPLASPTFTGTPAAPTATAGTNTTQLATTAFVRTEISNLVDAAPATLDTLNELAAALGDDPSFATTVTNSIATKVAKSGDTMTGALGIPLGSSGSPSLFFSGDTNTGFYSSGSDTINFVTGGTEKASIDSVGRLGIGGYGTGQTGYVYKLEVKNGTPFFYPNETGENAAALNLGRYSNGYGPFFSIQTHDVSTYRTNFVINRFIGRYRFSITDGTLGTEHQAELRPGTVGNVWDLYNFNNEVTSRICAGTDHSYINGGGNFGIGVTTPGSVLSLQRSDATAYAGNHTTITNNGIDIYNDQSSITNAFAGISFRVSGSGYSNVGAGSINLVNTGDGDGDLTFVTRNNGTSSEKLRITHDGKVGIGTTDPGNFRLRVPYSGGNYAPVEFNGPGTGAWGIGLVIRTTGGNDGAAILFRNRDTKNWQIRGETSGTGFQITEDGGDANYGSSFGTPRVHISAGGNVGIGLTDPDEKLEVNGNIHLAANGSLYFGAIGTNTRLVDDSGSNRTVLLARNNILDILNAAGSAWTTTLRTGIIAGGLSATTNLVLKSTTGAGTTDYISLAVGNNGATEAVRVINNGNVGIGTTTPSYKLQVNGSFGATTKSFRIDHPSRPNYTLEYGSLESPYHGVRLTGRGKVVKGSGTVLLPSYLKDLIHDDENINIQITNIKHGKTIYVDEIDLNNDQFTVRVDRAKTLGELEFFWVFTGVRKDVDNLVVEREK